MNTFSSLRLFLSMEKKQQTIATYNNSAQALAQRYNLCGARKQDIEEVFREVKTEHPFVLEIGCGNGRDAFEIVKKTTRYLGLDISEKLLELARETVPDGQFLLQDIEEYAFPENIDIIFAFASLIHVPKECLEQILKDAYRALNQEGILRLSLKYAERYGETTKTDVFGTRTYYLYSKEDIKNLAGAFRFLKMETMEKDGQTWLEVMLKKEGTE